MRARYGAERLLAVATAVIVAGVVLTASRVQLLAGGTGVLPATVVVPAAALLVVAFLSAQTARSFRFGLMTGLLALTASFVAVFGVSPSRERSGWTAAESSCSTGTHHGRRSARPTRPGGATNLVT